MKSYHDRSTPHATLDELPLHLTHSISSCASMSLTQSSSMSMACTLLCTNAMLGIAYMACGI
ncbi:hypothetical protein Noda2021_03430 [Candidatus Dependentiae bacterium Noda2021]|nr:hypothetical protein Noda2021_03430 [Candidatus Dependentiae bacterium Noda2021]